MTSDPPRPTASRRRFLGSAAVFGVAASAGCLGSAFESDAEEIEPEEPSDPPEGTAGEFYYVLENQDEFDIEVDDLYWANSALDGEDRDLILEYYSDAERVEDTTEDNESTTESPEENESTTGSEDSEPRISGLSNEDTADDTEEDLDDGDDADIDHDPVDPSVRADSEEEMGIIMNAYNEILVEHGNTDTGMLVGEVQNPFDGQAHGWGVKTEWLEAYNDGEMNEFGLWMNVANSRVYGDDDEDGGLETDLEDDEFEDDEFEDEN